MKVEGKEEGMAGQESRDIRYLIVRAGDGNLIDLFRFLSYGGKTHVFLGEDDGGPIPAGHRWVIFVSILVRRLIAFFGKPMKWNGMLLEFLLNLLSQNGGLFGLLRNLFTGNVVVPQRGSESFISAIGHLDSRLDLWKFDSSTLGVDEISKLAIDSPSTGSRVLMDLCMMASKLAYENTHVIRNIINHRWKMHFVDFYNCWNDFQKARSTQAFILCDKPEDANVVLISFRGTEPFDPHDWITDVDYSWYEIPQMGKVHMGFLEALGLGNRNNLSTFQFALQEDSSGSYTGQMDEIMEMDEMIACYAIRNKLKSLLSEHKKAKFVVTGHSLGGALAILFPAILLFYEENELMERLLAVYTFGQPRVGDEQFERFMEGHVCHPVSKYFRVVYCNDLVPRVPYDNGIFLYKHFGHCIYYNSFYVEQNVNEEPNRNYFELRYLLPEYLNAAWEFLRSLTMSYTYGPEYKETLFSISLRVLGLAVPGISEHCPSNYVNSIRLGRSSTRMVPTSK
ncbi:LOW QUALITY PROTEIN: triacylglycerol lipase OBL1-like [Typha latifolia]|uniref:LOW QUALITY PROTEIN: triacylglycerol lipase OBL1-like n=1 Tax=Typha latifolia TaxID=4733 RepID=UPI003C302854